MSSSAVPRVVRFGQFELDTVARYLRKQNRTIKLQDQPFQVLALLVRHPGDIVTRDELRRTLWPADTFVEFDQGLNTAIKKVRVALADSADNPRFIETVPRKGYRFIAPVEWTASVAIPSPPAGDTTSEELSSVPCVIKGATPRHRAVRLWFLGGLTALALGAIVSVSWIVLDAPERERAVFSPVPLTSYPGPEFSPTFSPDGNEMAFSRRPPETGHSDIYVKSMGAYNALRLTSASEASAFPAWSPDGRFIAFARTMAPGRAAVYLISPLGGAERKLTEIEAAWRGVCVSWHPSGQWLVVPDRSPASQLQALFAVSIKDGDRRPLTFPQKPGQLPLGNVFRGDMDPALSPDGEALAFVRGGELHLLALSDRLSPKGEPQRLTFDNDFIFGPAWTPDGRGLVFCRGEPHRPALYEIRFSRLGWRPGKPRLLAFAGRGVRTPTISRQGRLAYAVFGNDGNIWRIDLAVARAARSPGTRLIASTHLDHTPQYSPDGKRIAFASNRSGSHEIWICDADGSNARQLTSFGGPYTADPQWSPDGRRIMFHCNRGGKWYSYTINAEGGNPSPVPEGNLDARCWSRDGKWVYLTGKGQLWKIPANGGSAVQITRGGGEGGGPESPDGRLLYYTKKTGEPDREALWSVPVEGGTETQVLSRIGAQYFAPVEKGIYFFTKQESGPLLFYDFRTRRTEVIAEVPGPLAWGLSVSPDRRWILYAHYEETGGDLWSVENFR